MMHAEAAQLLAAGAVLHDLGDDERVRYDAHRAGCGACAALERELEGVLAELALLVPEREVPDGLLAGIRQAIGLAGDGGPAARRS